MIAEPATAEKGYLDVELSIATPGGHSSVPRMSDRLHCACATHLPPPTPFGSPSHGNRTLGACHQRARGSSRRAAHEPQEPAVQRDAVLCALWEA